MMEKQNWDPDDDPYDDSSSDDEVQSEYHGLPTNKSKLEQHDNCDAYKPSHHDQYGYDNFTLGIGGLVRAFKKYGTYGSQ